MIKTFKDVDLKNKTILYRSPYDIGVTEKNGKLVVKDDSRIRATLPSLEYLLSQNCKIAILTWVKRPEGIVDEKLRTIPHAEALESLLNHPVEHINECVGKNVQEKISHLEAKQIIMLENTRFHPEEFTDDDAFAKELTNGFDYIVFDGFPQSHRKHASTTGILRHLPACIGLYFEEELTSLSKVFDNPKKPVTAIIGGAKISDKINTMNNLINIADIILLGGGPANVFMSADGKVIGNSFIEDTFVDKAKREEKNWIDVARELKTKTKHKNLNETFQISVETKLEQIQIPYDLVIGKSMENDTDTQLVVVENETNVVPPGWGAYDIGPVTSKMYTEIILQSGTVLWAGPPGIFELDNYSNGSKQISQAMAMSDALTIIAGGDTIEAVNKLSDPSKINHISLAGGATLQFLANEKMPVIELLNSSK